MLPVSRLKQSKRVSYLTLRSLNLVVGILHLPWRWHSGQVSRGGVCCSVGEDGKLRSVDWMFCWDVHLCSRILCARSKQWSLCSTRFMMFLFSCMSAKTNYCSFRTIGKHLCHPGLMCIMVNSCCNGNYSCRRPFVFVFLAVFLKIKTVNSSLLHFFLDNIDDGYVFITEH